MAGRREVLLRLYLVGTRVADRDRATRIAERLEARRRVLGRPGEWWVTYEAADVTEAMATCEAELSRLDPAWHQILDFAAVPAEARLGARPV